MKRLVLLWFVVMFYVTMTLGVGVMLPVILTIGLSDWWALLFIPCLAFAFVIATTLPDVLDAVDELGTWQDFKCLFGSHNTYLHTSRYGNQIVCRNCPKEWEA